MRLVKDAKRAWRWLSVQAFVAAGAIQTTWVSLTPDMRASIPADWVTYATVAVCVLGIIGRLVDQGGDNA